MDERRQLLGAVVAALLVGSGLVTSPTALGEPVAHHVRSENFDGSWKFALANTTGDEEPAFADADEPAVLLGEDRGLNPVEYVLAGLAGLVATEGADQSDANMRNDQNRLIAELAQVNPRIVVVLKDGNPVLKDEGIRRGTTLEKMGQLKPAFKPDGRITAATSSQISDGAAALLLMSREKADALGLTPRARIVDQTTVGVDPVTMLTGPIPATRKLLERNGMTIGDIDLIEINEAFAAVVLRYIQALALDPARGQGVGPVDVVLVAVKAAIACGLAFYVGALLPPPIDEYKYYAALGAFTVVGLVLADSVKESLQVFGAVTVGVAVAVLVQAVGASLCGILSLMTVLVNWFERRRTTALGLMQVGMSVGGLTVPLIALGLAGFGWRPVSVVSGLIVFAVGLPAASLMHRDPAIKGLRPDGAASPADAPIPTIRKPSTRPGIIISRSPLAPLAPFAPLASPLVVDFFFELFSIRSYLMGGIR